MKTRITELLNIDYPIFQGGMAWVADGDLAGAVSKAGGLGIIGGGNAPKEVVKANIDKIKSLTDKPFGVNIMLLSPFVEDIVDLVIEEGVKVVTTGAGNPSKYMTRFHDAGITVIPVVPSVALAKRMEKIGGGSIISLSSTGNLVYIENYAGHGTAKAAVEAMARYAATELGEKNIRVNVVSGGPIETDALRAFTNYEEVRDMTAKLSPLNRMGQPTDLAGACLFLCSSKASWVTGHTFVIDGGTTFK